MFTREQILNMRPTRNNIIIHLDRRQEEIKRDSGFKLKLDTSFEPEKHANITGHVVALPDRLFFDPTPGQAHSLDWDTDMELEVGDYVISYYLSSINAMSGDRNGRLLEDDQGNKYLIVRYDRIYAARRGDQIVTVNGFNLLTPVRQLEERTMRERMQKLDLAMPANTHAIKGAKIARLKYVAKPNRRYRDPRYWDYDDPINPGDLLLIRRNAGIPIEYEYHTSLEGDQVFYRVQRNFIFGVVDESVLN